MDIREKYPLNPVPSEEWMIKYKELMKDEWIRKKLNRERRLKDKQVYIKKFLPEIKKFKRGCIVLDIGPGPGEFLEVCRKLGLIGFGVDAKETESMMGNKYLEYSKLFVERQKLRVMYMNFEHVLENKLPFGARTVSLINSQGSIEQVFRKHTTAPETDGKYHESHQWEWKYTKGLHDDFAMFFGECWRVLEKGGILFIYCNGSKNLDVYNALVIASASKDGMFKVDVSEGGRVHKMRRR